jgi:uncharacterized membrane-anchored protein
LRARVKVSFPEQNRQLMELIDRRAQIKLRLQETVEGLSVIAIGYYGVDLLVYALKGAKAVDCRSTQRLEWRFRRRSS